jgi:hypothetical protein
MLLVQLLLHILLQCALEGYRKTKRMLPMRLLLHITPQGDVKRPQNLKEDFAT